MKYIKTFEFGSTKIFKEGDYVVLNLDAIRDENDMNNFTHMPSHEVVLIIKTNRNMAYSYLVKEVNDDTMSIKGTEILRPASIEEIEEYKMKKDTDKYNL